MDVRNSAAQRGEALIAFHRKNAGLGDDPGEIVIWHALADLLEWCDEESPRVDFDAVLLDVRDFLRSEYDGPRRT